MLDLTLCMIVKNEAKHLERCLTSVRSLVREIIVGDTGSEDESIDIARQFGARIVPVVWEDDFALARNTVLEHATSPWILILDADEEAVSWNIPEMISLLTDSEVFGYYVQLVSYVGDRSSREYMTDSVCRLFRNDPRIRFQGTIHEDTARSILELPGSPIAFSSLTIAHYGYLQVELVSKNKSNRNLSILQKALTKTPEDLLLRYALGTEHFQAQQYEQAASILLPLLKEVRPNQGYGSDLYIKASYSLFMLGQDEQAGQVIEAGLSQYADFSDLHDLKASVLLRQGKPAAALDAVNMALRCGDVSASYTTTSGCGTYRTHYSAARICERLFHYQEALQHYERALSFRSDYLPAWSELIPLLLLEDRPLHLIGLLQRYPEAWNAELLSLLIPSALNARSTEIIQYVLYESSCARNLLPPLLDIMHLFQKDKDESACFKLHDMLRTAPDDPMLIRYLWASAWKRQDIAYARYMAEQFCQDSLYTIQQVMETEQQAASNFSDGLGVLQMLVQVGAWEAALLLYQHASSPTIHMGAIPPSLFCGLLKAPANIKKEWCRIYENRCLEAPTNRLDSAETFVFTLMAQSCGTILDLPARRCSAPDRSAAYIGAACYQLSKASYYGGLSIEESDFRVYFRAFSF
ncbi:tetratricopeptide repeat-containing glycosyltransferase family 2 protein [Paenibacillus sp. UNC451MF]|uniref:tetratricopeptide repeat-containing glycosyltransferase family 2 protein n=1 Tax=Paenibacillus sp. UNC451MF TaxID=1449063 RepID=UPI00068EBEC8|nr:glycosyltransferase family 2 protein [Paenibacillus sp. UNC451MF]